MVVFFVQKTDREMFSKFFQCFVLRLLKANMGRVQAGWLLGQVTAKGHGRGMRRQAQSERGATDTRDAERHGFSALSRVARVSCSTLA